MTFNEQFKSVVVKVIVAVPDKEVQISESNPTQLDNNQVDGIASSEKEIPISPESAQFIGAICGVNGENLARKKLGIEGEVENVSTKWQGEVSTKTERDFTLVVVNSFKRNGEGCSDPDEGCDRLNNYVPHIYRFDHSAKSKKP